MPDIKRSFVPDRRPSLLAHELDRCAFFHAITCLLVHSVRLGVIGAPEYAYCGWGRALTTK